MSKQHTRRERDRERQRETERDRERERKGLVSTYNTGPHRRIGFILFVQRLPSLVDELEGVLVHLLGFGCLCIGGGLLLGSALLGGFFLLGGFSRRG